MKSEITKIFNTLKEAGYSVSTFNSHRAVGKGMLYFPDHVFIGHGRIIFVEVKIGKDTMSDGQQKLHTIIQESVVKNRFVDSFIVRDTESAIRVRDRILNAKKDKGLME